MYASKIKEELIGKNIILRKFKMEDQQAIYEYGSDPQTMKYLVWEGVKTLVEVEKIITEYYTVTPGVYAIALLENNQCIGAIDIRIVQEHDKASFGYVLHRKYWGQGYMTEALSLVLKHCFEDLKLQRVESTHYMGNDGSGKVMEKCGMKKEGVAIREVKVKGVYQDVVHYRILREEFLKY